MNQGEVRLEGQDQESHVKTILDEMLSDGLVQVENQEMRLTAKGKPFLRNACVALDERLLANKPDSKIFSQSM